MGTHINLTGSSVFVGIHCNGSEQNRRGTTDIAVNLEHMEAKAYMYDIYLFFAPANMIVPGTLLPMRVQTLA